jgi:protein-S-isoprenylcysteine O-methyltransferase Ste14
MPQRFIYPPIWLLFGLVGVFACNEFFPGPRFTGPAGQLAGGLLILAGLVLLVYANSLFTRVGNDVIPFRNVTTLVTSGVYRYTRNPMYLGMLLVLLGSAVTVGASTALLVAPLFMAIIEVRFIRPEEEMLHRLFPGQYADYCAKVRRWL